MFGSLLLSNSRALMARSHFNMSSRNDRRNDRGGSGRDNRRDDSRRGDRDREESKSRRDAGRIKEAEHRDSPSHGGPIGGGGGGNPPMIHHGGPPPHHGGGGGQPKGAGALNGAPMMETDLNNDLPKKKFTGRCRLFVGNLPNEVKETELKELFSPHGDIAECYISGKGFAFLRMDTRAHAESAKEAIDGSIIHGRQVRVRFAVHGAALRVKELSPTVSNEMLYHAFSHFGEVERAVHIVDDKGRPTGEGIVEFERKPSCKDAYEAISSRVFFLTACPKPILAEMLEPKDEDDGLSERMIPRTAQLTKERELGPRFPNPNTFEFQYGLKWKELYELEKQRRAQLENELKEARRRLEQDMEIAYEDYQTDMLRKDLQRRQQELERLEAARRDRLGRSGPPEGLGQFGAQMGAPPASMAAGYGAFNRGPPPSQYNGPSGPMGVPPPMSGVPGVQMGGPGGPMGGGPPANIYRQEQPNVPGGPLSGGFNQSPSQQANQQNTGAPSGRPTNGIMPEGVQKLLQMFRNDQNLANQKRSSDPQQHANGPVGYGSPQQDYPTEKRMRR